MLPQMTHPWPALLVFFAACKDRDAVVDTAPPPCPAALDSTPGRAVTTSGVLLGEDLGAAWLFRGVPFAAPPEGAQRWRPPQAPACPSEPVDATGIPAECAQFHAGAVSGQEDCLTLNVWTAATPGEERPVMVFLHGGGNESGSASGGELEATPLAAEHGLVVVTAEYRLGALGFLGHPDLAEEGSAANLALQDQLAALRWVQENIAAFGGDPARVLLVGQSAGSMATCRLLTSPAAAGLFSAAALHSGSCRAQTLEAAEATALAYAAERGCGPEVEDPAACLRALPLDQAVPPPEGREDADPLLSALRWEAAVDGVWLPQDPSAALVAGAALPVPTLIMTTREETGSRAPTLDSQAGLHNALEAALGAELPVSALDRLLELYPVETLGSYTAVYVAITTDLVFTCPARRDALGLLSGGELSGAQAPVYRAVFAEVPDWVPEEQAAEGATHGGDLFFLFGAMDQTQTWSPEDLATRQAMRSAHAALAAGEDPGWAALGVDEPRVTLLESGAQVQADNVGPACELLRVLQEGEAQGR